MAILKKFSCKSSHWRIVSSVVPSMISVVFWIERTRSLIFSSHSAFDESSRIKNKSFLRAFNPELIAIDVAVSTLSPVSIQICIPADFRSSIVRCTFSCSLSSTPVTPKNSKSLSSSFTTLLIA